VCLVHWEGTVGKGAGMREKGGREGGMGSCELSCYELFSRLPSPPFMYFSLIHSFTYPFSKTVESVKDGMQGVSMPVLMQVCRGREGGREGRVRMGFATMHKQPCTTSTNLSEDALPCL